MTLIRDKTSTGLSGEYYVLAQLAHRGLVGALTLSNTKAVDILVSNAALRRVYKLEVKTTQKGPVRERLFGEEPSFRWPMSVKHEKVGESRLYYCFVVLAAPTTRPHFFIVPSSYVAWYVREEHRHWRASRRRAVATTSLRTFRIPLGDPDGFEDNWRVFTKRGRGPANNQLQRTRARWRRSSRPRR